MSPSPFIVDWIGRIAGEHSGDVRVELGGRPGVARLVAVAPQVDTRRVARRETLGERDQYEAPTAPGVEGILVPAIRPRTFSMAVWPT